MSEDKGNRKNLVCYITILYLISIHNPPSLFFSLVAIWPATAQVWSPVKSFSC